jgi:hypothetical protein
MASSASPTALATARPTWLGPALRGAALSLACLPPGLLLAFATMKGLDRVAPSLQDRLGPPLFFAVLAIWGAVAGAVWADRMAGHGAARWRVRAGGGLGFGLAAPSAVWGLTAAESALLLRAQDGATMPMHVVFGVIFPAATFGVVLLASLGLALGAGQGRRGVRIALRAALAAGLAFSLVDVAMHLAGWHVGAPDAESRLTMLVVTALGLLAATLAGGAILGRALAGRWGQTSVSRP